MRMHHFWTQNGPSAPNKNFLGKIITIISICLLAPFAVQNLEKFLQQTQSHEDAPILGPKWLIWPNENFLRRSGIFIFNFENISHLVLVFLLLALNM